MLHVAAPKNNREMAFQFPQSIRGHHYNDDQQTLLKQIVSTWARCAVRIIVGGGSFILSGIYRWYRRLHWLCLPVNCRSDISSTIRAIEGALTRLLMYI